MKSFKKALLKKIFLALIVGLTSFCVVLYILQNKDINKKGNTSQLVDHSLMPSDPIKLKFINRLQDEKPDIVMIGNSMIGEGVDEKSFSQLTKLKSVRFWRGGVSSSWWYLVLKNIVAKANCKPKVVLISFRDRYLTTPDYRVTGEYKTYINEMCDSKGEPLLDRLAYLQNISEIQYITLKHCIAYRQKDSIKQNFNDFIKANFAKHLTEMELSEVNKVIDVAFSKKNLNQKIHNIKQLEAEKNVINPKDFNEQLTDSFLPSIVRIAKNNNIKLIFVRFKRRRDLTMNSQPEELKIYIKKLAKYLNDNGCEFIDFTNEASITLKHYGTGDHLNRKEGRVLVTKLLSKRVKALINQ